MSSKSTFDLHEEWQYINASLTFICSAWYRTSKTRQISTQHRNQSCIVSRAPLVFSNLSVFNILQWVYDVSNSQNNPFFYWSVPGTNWSHTTTAAGLQDPAQLCCPPPFLLIQAVNWSQGDTNSPFIKKKKKKKYFVCFISPEAAYRGIRGKPGLAQKVFGRGQKPGSIDFHWLKLVRNSTPRQYKRLENGISQGQKQTFPKLTFTLNQKGKLNGYMKLQWFSEVVWSNKSSQHS